MDIEELGVRGGVVLPRRIGKKLDFGPMQNTCLIVLYDLIPSASNNICMVNVMSRHGWKAMANHLKPKCLNELLR